ncbi:hypothetical protein O0L34_g19375 [Tuta absoluta]|nr:hypothetical protein O0L34_g19375 [Tuta absoluta]
MSESKIDVILKSLRLLPDFDGNPHVLTRFIHLCDELVAEYVGESEANKLNNLALLNGILNKITRSAARLINSNGIPESWSGIRQALVNNFADHRDETSLYNDLALLTQGSSTPQEFYEKCQNIFSTLMTYISLHETVDTTIASKRDLYRKLTLQAFLRGLKDPLGSRIRCMRPETIEKALEFVHEEMNTLYMQHCNEHTPERKSLNQQFPPKFGLNQTPMPFASPFQRPSNFNMNMPGTSRPNFVPMPQRPPVMWKPNFNQSNRSQGPTRTQQMFAARPANYNPQSNVFRLPQRNSAPNGNFNTQRAQPMSDVSHYVTKQLPSGGHDWSRQGNPPPSNYFKTSEMNFNQCFDYDYDSYSAYDNYEYCPEWSDEYESYQPYDYDSRTFDDGPQPQYREIDQSAIQEIRDEVSSPRQEGNFPKAPNFEESK